MSSLPSPRFILGKALSAEESRTLEFKEVTSTHPVSAIANTADEYAVAFLNGEGGTILWGGPGERSEIVDPSEPQGELPAHRVP